jgi:ketosteroid isomerase-like protein
MFKPTIMKSMYLIILLAVIAGCSTQESADAGPTGAEIVQGLYDAFAEGDVDAVFASLHEDVDWNEAENFIYGGQFIGHDAVGEGVFARLGGEWEYWNLVNVSVQNIEGNRVLAQGRYNAKYKANGNVLDAQFAHYFELDENGLVTKFQQYTDTKQVADVTAVSVEQEAGEE